MRTSVIVMLVLAAVFGILAVFAGQRWLSHQQAALQRQNLAEQPQKPADVPISTIVVAAGALRYGDEITLNHLKELPWPAGEVPKGAFKKREDLVGKDKRVVLTAMEPNEPILDSKITGPGQRGTLSALLEDGMVAMTLQVNEIVGVAGFVLPGERVDVLMTRFDSGGDGGPSHAASQNTYAEVVLRNARVLTAGQIVDEKASKPSIVNAVTLEVSPLDGQRLSLAGRAGTLSLMLRKSGEAQNTPLRRVVLDEIGQSGVPNAPASVISINVGRGIDFKSYTVPVFGKPKDSQARTAILVP